MTTDEARRATLAANLAAVRERIAGACRDAGRDPDEVTLIVVTKTYPASDVLHLVSLGVTDVGENRDQEAAPKAAEVAAALAGSGGPAQSGVTQSGINQSDGAEPGAARRPRWHFVGRLQRNKCRSVVRYADLVHSVDSVRLAQALDRAALGRAALGRAALGRPEGEGHGRLDVLVQVSLDADPSRGGAVATGGVDEDVALDPVLATVAAAEGLRLRGLMAVAPLDWEPERAFATLAEIHVRVRAQYPDATILSAGMSGDLEAAIRHGATHVRVGSAILGHRS
jgi:Predicted enzyme with a TIM-barrel fold